MSPKRLALIPARSGSKGVSGKNLREVAGEPLLVRALLLAKGLDLFDRVHLSTDSDSYAEAARAVGVEVPFLRPAELATDTALVADAIADTLARFEALGERFDTLVLLEPTSPLRTPDIVREVTLAAEADGWDAAFTVSRVPLHHHPLKQYFVDAAGEASFCHGEARPNVNRQELHETYVRNGLCYAVRVPSFLETHSITGKRARAIVADAEAISIDTEQDLAEVRALLERSASGAGGEEA